MNKESITIQECDERYYAKGEITIINDGKIKGFAIEKENIPADR